MVETRIFDRVSVFPWPTSVVLRDSVRAVLVSRILYTPWNISVSHFSVPMLQAIHMVTDMFVRLQWLLKAVCRCGVVERTYRVTQGAWRRRADTAPSRAGQEKIWHAAFTAVTPFYFFCPTSVSKLWRICGYINISDCVKTVYDLNNTGVKHFYTNRKGARGWLFIIWGAGLAVNGRIHDVGQSVLQSSFEQEVLATPLTSTFFPPYLITRGGLY